MLKGVEFTRVVGLQWGTHGISASAMSHCLVKSGTFRVIALQSNSTYRHKLTHSATIFHVSLYTTVYHTCQCLTLTLDTRTVSTILNCLPTESLHSLSKEGPTGELGVYKASKINPWNITTIQNVQSLTSRSCMPDTENSAGGYPLAPKTFKFTSSALSIDRPGWSINSNLNVCSCPKPGVQKDLTGRGCNQDHTGWTESSWVQLPW